MDIYPSSDVRIYIRAEVWWEEKDASLRLVDPRGRRLNTVDVLHIEKIRISVGSKGEVRIIVILSVHLHEISRNLSSTVIYVLRNIGRGLENIRHIALNLNFLDYGVGVIHDFEVIVL